MTLFTTGITHLLFKRTLVAAGLSLLPATFSSNKVDCLTQQNKTPTLEMSQQDMIAKDMTRFVF